MQIVIHICVNKCRPLVLLAALTSVNPLTMQHSLDLPDASPGQAPCMDAIIQVLENKRFRFTCETDLQDGIEIALKTAGLPFERESVLSARDRPDFVVAGIYAIEVKIKGTLPEAVRQLQRYTEHPQIHALLLVGSPYWIRQLPNTIGGKPIFSMRLTGSLL